ncbi:hypothetical protein EV368DRAFT_82507 [Lentinula lateritia]|nr:hypothetical protein EV368DRAFT_82507 [Lentinula lateritia]
MAEFVHALNNFAQSRHLTVVYEVAHTGSQNAGVWTAIVYIDGVEHGRATDAKRDVARADAAKIALRLFGLNV